MYTRAECKHKYSLNASIKKSWGKSMPHKKLGLLLLTATLNIADDSLGIW